MSRNTVSASASDAEGATTDALVHSIQNARIKAVRTLLRRRQRDRDSKFLVEGHRLVLDSVDAGLFPECIFYTHQALARGKHGERLRSIVERTSSVRPNSTVLVSPEVMQTISDTVTPQGVVAVVPRPNVPFPPSPTLLLVCDAVHDPGNLGTLLRAAAGAGVDAAILMSGCADAWSLKTLRAGMGAQLRLPLRTASTWDEVQPLLSEKYRCSICLADGALSEFQVKPIFHSRGAAAVHYTEYDWTKPSAIIIGSEAAGPSEDARRCANYTVYVPLENGVESLNAAVAGAVLLFEAKRQRSISSKNS